MVYVFRQRIKTLKLGISRLIATFEKTPFSSIATSLGCDILEQVLFFQKTAPYLIMVFQKYLFSVTCFSFKFVKKSFWLFVASIHTSLWAYKITVYFLRFCFFKKAISRIVLIIISFEISS